MLDANRIVQIIQLADAFDIDELIIYILIICFS